MKKYLFAIAMVLSLSMNADAAAQKHRHSPRTEQVDSTKNNRDAIEAFSDTTAVAGDSIDTYSHRHHISFTADDEDVKGIFEEAFSGFDGKALTGVLIVLGTLFILFVLFPIIIIIAVIYFINRNRKDRIKLAQMAMEKGQPIPDELLKEKQASWDRSDYQTGLRQMFTGVGEHSYSSSDSASGLSPDSRVTWETTLILIIRQTLVTIQIIQDYE